MVQDTRLDLAAVLPLDILYLFTGVREDIFPPLKSLVVTVHQKVPPKGDHVIYDLDLEDSLEKSKLN